MFNIPHQNEPVHTDNIMSVTHAPNSLVDMILLSVMPMASRTPSNLSRLSQITSTSGEPRKLSSPMAGSTNSLKESLTSFRASSSPNMNLSAFISIRTSLRIVMVIQNDMSTPSRISVNALPHAGYFLPQICLCCSM